MRMNTAVYVPRNDHVLLKLEDDRYQVVSAGPMVEDLRPGDVVILPEFDEEEDEAADPRHPLDEEGVLYLVREYLIIAVERKPAQTNAYEDFHS